MWIILSIAAGTLQTVRNALAKDIAHAVTPALNSWARFTFNLPWATTVAAVGVAALGLPMLTPTFFAWCLAAGFGQLLGNMALVAAFKRTNFAESIALHKLEVVFTALVGVAAFGERPSVIGWLGIGLCALGTLAINMGRDGGPQGWRRAFHLSTGALLAMLCGLLFVVASFGVKGAVTELALRNPGWDTVGIWVPAHTLFHVTWIEVVVLSVGLAVRDPRAFAPVRRHWRTMASVGLTSYLSSFCWFWAFSLTLVAYVRAVGQIESVLSVLLAIFWWRERAAIRQLPGVAVVVLGMLFVLLQ
jgi:drug/metabolite transporter (DMT)-like permease